MEKLFQIPPVIRVTINKMREIKLWQECWGKEDFFTTSEVETGAATVKISVRVPQKSKRRIQCYPAIPFLDTNSIHLRHIFSDMFIATVFTMAGKWNHHPSTDARIKKPCKHIIEFYVPRKKNNILSFRMKWMTWKSSC